LHTCSGAPLCLPNGLLIYYLIGSILKFQEDYNVITWFCYDIHNGSDSVTRVNDSTRVTIIGDSDSTRVTLRKMMTRLESRFSQNDSTRVTINDSRLESESFLKNLRACDRQTQFVCIQRKDNFFGPVMIKIGANFLFWLSSRVILYPKGQVFITYTEVDVRFAFHWGARRAQYRPTDTSSWSNQEFAYHDNGSRPHTVTLSLFQMKWFKLFEYKSNAKI